MAENLEPSEPPIVHDPLTPTPLTRRSQPAAERPSLPPDIEEQLAQLLQTVQVLSAHFLGEAAAPMESLRERTARRIKKFQRAGGDERAALAAPSDETPLETAAETGGTTDESTDRLALNKNIAWPRKNGAGESLPRAATNDGGGWRWPNLGFLLGAQAAGLLLLGVGYLIGHGTANPLARSSGGKSSGHVAVDLFGQPELTEQGFQTANEGLRAEHAGNQDAARKIYETALAKHTSLTGVNYRLALLAVQRNDRLESEQRLQRSMLDGENVVECCYVLARLAADKGDFEEACTQMERAARAQPFDGKYFFYWAETLRRQGKPQAAIAAFDQSARPALHRREWRPLPFQATPRQSGVRPRRCLQRRTRRAPQTDAGGRRMAAPRRGAGPRSPIISRRRRSSCGKPSTACRSPFMPI